MTNRLRLSVTYTTTLLIASCTLSTAHSAPPWVDARQIGPFLCQATFPLKPYGPLFAELPQLQRELGRTLGLPPSRRPINIYLFRDEAEHRAFLRDRYAHVPYRRALFIKEGAHAGVYAYRHAELDIDLRHECTHALLHSVLPTVPLWLDEGLAEYFEVPPGRRAFDHPHFESLRWNMRLGMVQSIEALEQRQELPDMDGLDYRYSWAWVHFMLHGPEPAHQALVAYISGLQRASDGQTASGPEIQLAAFVDTFEAASLPSPLSSRLAQALPNTTERMVHHFKNWHK